MRRDVFQGISDPTRRAIINLVAQNPLNLNTVATHFDVSRPAISRHVRVLSECGLITISQRGRERYCHANLRQLQEVSEWIEPYRAFWTTKLGALNSFLLKEKQKTIPIAAGKKPLKSKSK
jgi:DNA-binding transcriptional ArsR family regulator